MIKISFIKRFIKYIEHGAPSYVTHNNNNSVLLFIYLFISIHLLHHDHLDRDRKCFTIMATFMKSMKTKSPWRLIWRAWYSHHHHHHDDEGQSLLLWYCQMLFLRHCPNILSHSHAARLHEPILSGNINNRSLNTEH